MKTFLKSSLFLFLLSFLTFFFFSLLVLKRLWNLFFRTKSLEEIVHEVSMMWGKSLFALTPGWSLELSGSENFLPKGSSFVLVANHESATDILALYHLGLRFVWLAKKEAFKTPLIGTGLRWGGHIPVERGVKESHNEALKKCKDQIASGTPVLFFPEGTRSTLGYPKDFKVGAFKIAKEMGVPVLPVVLKGAGKLLRKGSLAYNEATMRIKVLEPTSSHENETVSEFTKRVEQLVISEHAKLP